MARAINISAFTVLLAVEPLSSEASTVGPEKFAVAFFQIVFVFARVLTTIVPGECALPVHLIGTPFTFIASVVRPFVAAFAMDVVVVELADEAGPISPFERAKPVLRTKFVTSLILSTIRPGFDTKTVLSIILPVAYIFGSTRVFINSPSAGFIVTPVSLINVAVGMDNSSLATGLIQLPVSFIFRAICPDLDSFSVPVSISGPLAKVDNTVIDLEGSFV